MHGLSIPIRRGGFPCLLITRLLVLGLASIWGLARGLADTTVLNCNEAALRAAVQAGGSITCGCDGRITLSQPLLITTDTILDAANHNITLSGNQSVRIFQVNPGIRLNLINVTIADGKSDQGGGLFNDGGIVTIQDCTFTGNQAVGVLGTNGPNLPTGNTSGVNVNGGPGGEAQGGAIYNWGTFLGIHCRFLSNSALGSQGGAGGSMWASDMVNHRIGVGGSGGPGKGGAIYQASGSLLLTNCLLHGNQALGSAGGSGAAGVTGWGFAPGAAGGVGGHGQGGGLYQQGS